MLKQAETVDSKISTNFGKNPLARYKKMEKVGEGVYGHVYKALDLETNKVIALKKMILEVFKSF